MTATSHGSLRAPVQTPGDLQEACQAYRQELRRFFERHAPQIDAAEDLVQLVYMRLLRSPPLAEIQDPRSFMYRVAWNVLRNENVRVQRERVHSVSCDPQSLAVLADTLGSLWVPDSDELFVQDQLDQLLRRMPRAWQVAFLRQYRDNHSYDQIANELKVSKHAVKKYIVSALAFFRSEFTALNQPQRKSRRVP